MTIQPAASSNTATATISRPAVEAESLKKTYSGGVEALKGVSFNVGSGAIFALLGPNGAGKSTIVKILTTLSRPTAGRASIMGRDVVREPERVRRVIGAVNFVVLPLAFLSSTFMPVSLMPQWMQQAVKLNPVNWAVEVGRQTLYSSVDWSLVGVHLAELLTLTLVCAWLSTRAFRSYQRSV